MQHQIPNPFSMNNVGAAHAAAAGGQPSTYVGHDTGTNTMDTGLFQHAETHSPSPGSIRAPSDRPLGSILRDPNFEATDVQRVADPLGLDSAA